MPTQNQNLTKSLFSILFNTVWTIYCFSSWYEGMRNVNYCKCSTLVIDFGWKNIKITSLESIVADFHDISPKFLHHKDFRRSQNYFTLPLLQKTFRFIFCDERIKQNTPLFFSSLTDKNSDRTRPNFMKFRAIFLLYVTESINLSVY